MSGFDVLQHSEIPLPGTPRFRSIAEMLEGGDEPVLVGPVEEDDRVVTLRDLRRAANRLRFWCRQAGLHPGDTIALLRPPRTPEIPLAVSLLALLANGMRVVLPMRWDPVTLPKLLAGAQAAAWWGDDERLERSCGVRTYRIDRDLRPFDEAADVAPVETDPDQDSLVLTTTGSTGEPKLVRYSEAALLRGAEAWRAAGLFGSEKTGGTSVCPLLSHSMGVRNVLHAVWTRRPTVLILPEWLEENPQRVASILTRHPPEHVTFGPALLRILAEYARAFPGLREKLGRSLRCIVSSGAAFEPAVRRSWPDVTFANAFGMTETQQVASTLLGGAPESLGRPLPGVSLAVRFTDRAERIGRLSVRSPFGAQGFDDWFDTGDLVRWTGEDLCYVGRANEDFLKNGLGVKMPLRELRERYGDLIPAVRATEFFSFPERDGAVAVAFVGESDPSSLVSDVREAAAARGGGRSLLDAPLLAVGLVRGVPPVLGPGKIHRARILEEHPALVDALAGRAVHPDVVEVPSRSESPFQPRISLLQEAIGLDWKFTGGRGDTLFGEVPVLDLVGGFGANLLGHGHPEILRAAEEALRGVPLLDQGAVRLQASRLAAELARRVSERTGRRYVVYFSSSGSEAVEIALKHAVLERRPPGRPVILALKRGFHGRTLGAMNALSRDEDRAPFASILGAKTVFLAPGDDRLLEATIAAEGANIVAAIVEPIQGEGGVFEIPVEWMNRLRAAGAPLLVDEIQCGLGRAGSFLASEGVRGDYYLFGKALGGGVAKIGAVLIDRARFVPEFDEMQSSTFGGDAYSCAVGLRVLEIIDRDDVPGLARKVGEHLTRRLGEVRAAFPRVLSAVRGRGGMLGVELAYPDDPPCAALRGLARRGLGYVAASYLLNRHRVRILPATSASNVLRIEPSAFLPPAEAERFAGALEQFCRALDASDLFELSRHLVRGEPVEAATPRDRLERQAPASGAVRIAFVHNLIHPEDELIGDAPECARLSGDARRELVGKLEPLLEMRPLLTFSRNLFGGRLWMAGVTIPASPATLDHLHRRGERAFVQRRLQESLDFAVSLGCGVATFGAHTSILTVNGKTLRAPPGVRICTGNTFTVAVALRDLGDVRGRCVGIVGAAGNIGSAIAELLPEEARLVFAGRSGVRLEGVRSRLGRGEIVTDLDRLRACDVIVVASSGSAPVLHASHVATGHGVTILDLSQPPGCSPRVALERPNARVLGAGLVRLPMDSDFVMSTHTPAGSAFACAAEAMILGLTGEDLSLTGDVRPENVRRLADLAGKLGLI